MATLGILTHRFQARKRYAAFAQEAERHGFDETILFTPEAIHFQTRTIHAYCRKSNQWHKQVHPFPDVVHDVGFYTDPGTIRKVRRFKSMPGIRFTGFGLGNKWHIHTRLMDSEFAPLLPETELYRGPLTATSMLQRFGTVMIKPINGKRGAGIMKLSCHPGRSAKPYVCQTGGGKPIMLTNAALSALLRSRFAPGGAVVQRWMNLETPEGCVFDLRALVQKEWNERWRLTEMAVRLSGVGRIASNVAKGGAIKEAYPFLAKLYGEAAAEHLAGECRIIALRLPSVLEKLYAKPFIELGIDLAVEKGGTVRIIEVNIKPGKKIVRALSGEDAYADASLLPIRYAGRLLLSARGSRKPDS